MRECSPPPGGGCGLPTSATSHLQQNTSATTSGCGLLRFLAKAQIQNSRFKIIARAAACGALGPDRPIQTQRKHAAKRRGVRQAARGCRLPNGHLPRSRPAKPAPPKKTHRAPFLSERGRACEDIHPPPYRFLQPYRFLPLHHFTAVSLPAARFLQPHRFIDCIRAAS